MKSQKKPLLPSKISSAILSVKDCAVYLGCTPQSIYKQIYRKQLPFRKLGGKIIFLKLEIDRFLEELPGLRLSEVIENVR